MNIYKKKTDEEKKKIKQICNHKNYEQNKEQYKQYYQQNKEYYKQYREHNKHKYDSEYYKQYRKQRKLKLQIANEIVLL